jgi:predicted RNase H-like HicB family nuclease
MTRRRYTVIIEKGAEGFGAFVPDLPGCVAAARTRAAVTRLIREAVEFHLEGLREEGIRFPRANARVAEIEVAV